MRRFILAAIATALLPASASADWVLSKQDNSATTSETIGAYVVGFSCHRGRGNLSFHISDLSLRGVAPDGGPLDQIRNLMLWIRLPDGRTDRWPVGVTPEGPSLSGIAMVSDFSLGFFANAENMGITEAATGRILFESDMKGTGAARIAFAERCGI